MPLSLLGPLEGTGVEGLSPRERVVLAALALRCGEAVAPDVLADALWRESPPDTWRKQLQASIGKLRRALGNQTIETASSGYRLVLGADEIDVRRFEDLIRRARSQFAGDEADRAAATYGRALQLWRGRPFGELDGWPSATSAAAELSEMHRSAEEELLEARLALGEHREVAAAAEALVRDEPLRERRWAVLALAQYRCGRQSDALRTLQLARRSLVEELGVDPGRELVELERAILQQEDSLDVHVRSTTVSDDCPYQGLASYDVDDVDRFFGRDAQVAACLERLRTTSLLVITGASGCGKSSLVRAGLVPVLRQRGISVDVALPSADLADRLDDRADTVVVVDQLEEIYSPAFPLDVARACAAAIARRAADGSTVVVTIRADHLTNLVAESELGRLVERGLHFVPPLSDVELRAVVEEPARRAGLRVEPGLVDLVVRDADGEPGALPMLSFALVETWRRRDGSVLTVEGYRASGGIQAAVARSADRVYDGLALDRRPLLRSLMLRLVAPSIEGEPMRCRVASSSLRGDPVREEIVDLLVRARLVTSQEDSIELAHEALARAWPRLRAWLDDDTEGQRILRHLAPTAIGWESSGRPDSELYRGARLEAALEYRRAARPDLTAVEVEFLDASERFAEDERRLLEARVRHESRQNHRLRSSLVVASLLLVVAMIAGVVAVIGGREASTQRDVAQDARDLASGRALVFQSLTLRATDRDVAALLAVEAWRRWPDDPLTRSALLGTFTAAGGFLGSQYVPDARSLRGALVPGTAQAVVVMDGAEPAVFDFETGLVDHRFDPVDLEASVQEVRVSADGRSVVAIWVRESDECWSPVRLRMSGGSGCATITVHDIQTGRLLLETTSPFGPGRVAISPDGHVVGATGAPSGDLAVFSVPRRGLMMTVPALDETLAGDGGASDGNPMDVGAVAFASGDELYLGAAGGLLRVVHIDRPGHVESIEVPSRTTNQHLVVGSDGLVVGSGPDGIVAVDPDAGETRWIAGPVDSFPDPCPWMAVSELADRIYCGTYFGVIREVERSTGRRTGLVHDPQLGSVGPLDVSADGRQLVAFGDAEAAVSRWRLDGGGAITAKVADGFVVSDGYQPGGSHLLVGARPDGVREWFEILDHAVWDPGNDVEIDPLDIGPAEGLGWFGQRSVLGYVAADDVLRRYDVQDHAVVEGGELVPAECERSWLAASGSRSYCYSSVDGELWTYDGETGLRLAPTIPVTSFPDSVSATRDGDLVVVTARRADEMLTTVYDGRTGAALRSMSGPQFTAVSPDGVLVGSIDGGLTRYDLETLEAVLQLPGARGGVNNMQFSEDGTTLLVASLNQDVLLYDVVDGVRLGDPFVGDAPFMTNGWLRSDGQELAVTDRSGVQIWDLDPDAMADAACGLAGRNLDETEWVTYFPDEPRRPTCEQFD